MGTVPVFLTFLNIEEISESVKKRAKEDSVKIVDESLIVDILKKICNGYSLDQTGILDLPRVYFI